MPNTELNKPYTHVVAGIIRDPQDPEKLFITQRQKGQHLENLWEFPGGKVEPLEPRFHALRRELKEETGIQVDSALPFFSVKHDYRDKKIYLDVWEVKHYQGCPHGREGQRGRWIALSELDQYSFPDADIPVIKTLTLPGELLITPDMTEQHADSFIEHLQRLMLKHVYPLLHFRSHQLDDDTYFEVAERLQAVCDPFKAELVISRPKLKSLKSSLFDKFRRRHLNSYILQSLTHNPFKEDVILSASCHDRAELKMAEQLNCHYALLSTIRETVSHPGRTAKGWYRFNQLANQANIPVYALGGVRRKDFNIARFQGGIGVAGITDFWTV